MLVLEGAVVDGVDRDGDAGLLLAVVDDVGHGRAWAPRRARSSRASSCCPGRPRRCSLKASAAVASGGRQDRQRRRTRDSGNAMGSSSCAVDPDRSNRNRHGSRRIVPPCGPDVNWNRTHPRSALCCEFVDFCGDRAQNRGVPDHVTRAGGPPGPCWHHSATPTSSSDCAPTARCACRDLMRELDVSDMTVRRDLEVLEGRGTS